MSKINNIGKDLRKGGVQRIANKAQLAEFFEVSVGTVDHWIRRDCPIVQRGGRNIPWEFDLLAVAEWRFSPQKQSSTLNPEELTPKERLDHYRGSRERDNLAKERGELIPFDVLDKVLGHAFAAVRSALMGQHAEISNEFPELDDDIILGIQQSNRAVLTELSQLKLPAEIIGALDALARGDAAAEGENDESMG